MADNKGWIKLHRQIQDCWIWNIKPYSEGQAWMDIILSCNHADKKIAFDGKPLIVERGQWITSIIHLADRWGWGRKKVSNFLNLIEQDGMIVQERNNKRTLIKVLNYEVYQVLDIEEGTTKEQQRNNGGTSEEHQRNTNKNDKNDKNINNIYINNINYIVEFLNQVCGTKFSPKTDSTKKHIKARLDDGYSVEDFEKVIKFKHGEWFNDPRMRMYLRPQTLFAPSKFESYLNQANLKGVKSSDKGTGASETGYDELPTEEELARYYATE